MVLLIGILIGYSLGRQQPSAARPTAQRTPDMSPPPAPKPPTVPDDFTDITGIGATFAQALHNLGILTFAQLAAQNPDDLAQRLPVRVTADRIRRDGWIEQAREKSGNG